MTRVEKILIGILLLGLALVILLPLKQTKQVSLGGTISSKTSTHFTFVSSTFNKTDTKTPSLRVGLVGHWTMDGADVTSTGVVDRSGSGFNGARSGKTNVALGKIGQAMSWDGTAGYIVIGNNSSLRSLTLSVCALIFTNSPGTRNTIISNGDGAAYSTNNYIFGTNSTNNRLTFFGRTPESQLFSSNNAFTLGQWNQVCFTADGTNISFYSNGYVLGSPQTVTLGTDNTFGSDIGITTDSLGNHFPFNGSIDDVRVYNRVLSAAEILQLYQMGGSKINQTPSVPSSLSTGLVGWWTMDGPDVTATTVSDKSGQGIDGTKFGSPKPVAGMGKIGQGISFNGTNNQYVSSTKSIGISGNATYTVSGWYYFKDSVLKGVLGWGNTGITLAASGLAWNVRGTNVLAWEYAGNNPVYTSTPITLNRWIHIVFVKTPGAISATTKIYYNAILQTNNAASSGATPNITDSPFVIGRWANDLVNGTFNGFIDDMRVYNRALTAAEIQQLYQGGI